MYDNLEEAITHKSFIPTPKAYPTVKVYQHYAVEPWQKNTLQVEIKEDNLRKLKTFYHTPMINKHEKQYTTHRGFQLRREEPSKFMSKPKSLAEVSRKSVVNHYNINGNILGERIKSNNSLPFQLPIKKIKSFQSKERTKKDEQRQPFPIRATVSAMKRRVSHQRQRSGTNFIRFGGQRDEVMPHFELVPKRSKVLRLGYQKISHFRGLVKQNSQQLSIRGALV